MSYDLVVYAKRQAKASDLDVCFSEHVAMTAEGTLRRDGFLLLTASDGGHAEVDGPSRTEAEDLPDAANGSIGASGWLVQISVRPSTPTWETAVRFTLASGPPSQLAEEIPDLG